MKRAPPQPEFSLKSLEVCTMRTRQLSEDCEEGRLLKLARVAEAEEEIERVKNARYAAVLQAFERRYYANWKNRTPFLVLMTPATPFTQSECAGVYMINPDYMCKSMDHYNQIKTVNSFSSHVHFGKVCNAKEIFGSVVTSKFVDLSFTEQKFCEFPLDSTSDRVKSRMSEFSGSEYPYLIVTLKKRSFSIHALQNVYSFYVLRRLLHVTQIPFELPIVNLDQIHKIVKHGVW